MSSPRSRVAAAFDAVPRRDHLPAHQVPHADKDVPLRIGHGATNSQPSTVAAMLELLDARPGHRVLDVGAGSGWTTALLGHLVGPQGRVVGVELVPALVASARPRLERSGMPWATIEAPAPGVLGSPEQGPYDRVLVSAMADELPHALADQLAEGGRMVVPVAGRMVVAERSGGRVRERTAPGYYQFVPLRRPRADGDVV